MLWFLGDAHLIDAAPVSKRYTKSLLMAKVGSEFQRGQSIKETIPFNDPSV